MKKSMVLIGVTLVLIACTVAFAQDKSKRPSPPSLLTTPALG